MAWQRIPAALPFPHNGRAGPRGASCTTWGIGCGVLMGNTSASFIAFSEGSTVFQMKERHAALSLFGCYVRADGFSKHFCVRTILRTWLQIIRDDCKCA